MKQRDRGVVLWFIGLWFVTLTMTSAYGNPSPPITNNGQKWRIGYLEGGPYSNYQSILKQMVLSLMDAGWIEKEVLPEPADESETRTIWKFLSEEARSEFLVFSMENYWSYQWENEAREKEKAAAINRLKKDGELDLMLAFGTWAGQDLANNQHATPTMVLSASNAVRAGIISSVEDSGYDHVHAWIDPDRTDRQIRLFHELTGFKKLGVAFENDIDGRSYAGIADVLRLSKELDFAVVECHLPVETGVSGEDAALIQCHEKLAPNIDSMFITDYAGLTTKSIVQLLMPLFQYKVPMFAQTRYDLVKYGILMGTGRADFNADAEFYTETFTQILHGAKPRDLPQKFESPLSIVVNLESAKRIGFRIPLDILAGAFEIHENIQVPGEK